MIRDAMYTEDTLNGNDTDINHEIEDMLDELAVATPTDKELANLQKSLLSSANGIADFLSDM